MSRKYLHVTSAALAASVALALSGPAWAQASPTTQQASASTKPASAATKQADAASKDQRVAARNIRASQLIGKDVRNVQGEDLGDIKDIILDVNSGRVHYVVLSFGGFLGLGDKLFAYPTRFFKPAADKDELVLNIDKDRFKNAPGFDAKAYPDWQSPAYRHQVDRYFGTAAMPAGPNMRFVRASELLGKDVNDPSGRDLGEIQDVVINMSDSDVRYAVIEFDQSWSLKEKLFAFPLRAFGGGKQGSDDLVLNVSKDTLNNVPGFDKRNWPNLNASNWVTDVDRYLVATAVIPMPSTTNDALFRKLDTNRDGVLSADEIKTDSSIKTGWKKMDKDSDGRVTRAEFNAKYRTEAKNVSSSK